MTNGFCLSFNGQAYEKCFQNLHYVERYEDHTIAHAIQAKYEKTKVNMSVVSNSGVILFLLKQNHC